jgi:hypothetical protein
MNIKSLNELPKEEKIEFFQKCQDLLVKNQPESEFILREEAENRDYFLDLFLKYKGFAYTSEKIAVLFNKHRINSLPEAQEAYQDKVFDPPAPDANTYTVDFITTKMSKDVLQELYPVFHENLEFMCFLRMGKVSFFRFDVLKSALADEFDQ